RLRRGSGGGFVLARRRAGCAPIALAAGLAGACGRYARPILTGSCAHARRTKPGRSRTYWDVIKTSQRANSSRAYSQVTAPWLGTAQDVRGPVETSPTFPFAPYWRPGLKPQSQSMRTTHQPQARPHRAARNSTTRPGANAAIARTTSRLMHDADS